MTNTQIITIHNVQERYCNNVRLGQKLGCFDAVQHFEMTGKGSRDWKTPEQISGSTVFRAVERRTTCTFGFHMVAEKWFAPCGKCEENRGRGAWVIGELSSRGLEASECWTQTFVYFPDRGAGRHKKGGKWWAEMLLETIEGLQVAVLICCSYN